MIHEIARAFGLVREVVGLALATNGTNTKAEEADLGTIVVVQLRRSACARELLLEGGKTILISETSMRNLKAAQTSYVFSNSNEVPCSVDSMMEILTARLTWRRVVTAPLCVHLVLHNPVPGRQELTALGHQDQNAPCEFLWCHSCGRVTDFCKRQITSKSQFLDMKQKGCLKE